MDRTRIPKGPLELKFKGKRPMGLRRARESDQLLKDIKDSRKS
jgi:hypothetical protein